METKKMLTFVNAKAIDMVGSVNLSLSLLSFLLWHPFYELHKFNAGYNRTPQNKYCI